MTKVDILINIRNKIETKRILFINNEICKEQPQLSPSAEPGNGEGAVLCNYSPSRPYLIIEIVMAPTNHPR
jgi:hypothetical protein